MLQAASVIPILLQHSCAAQDQQLVCKLLSVSKAVRTRASQLLHGRMAVTVADSKAAAFSEWLSKHLHLVQALHLDLPVVHPYSAEAQCKDDDSDSDTDGESEVGDAEVCWLCPATESRVAAAMQQASAAANEAPAAASSASSVATVAAVAQTFQRLVGPSTSAACSGQPLAIVQAPNCSTVTQPATPRSRSGTPEPLLGPSMGLPANLQSFSTETCSILVLEQLPCGQLTQLHLQFAADHPPFLARAAAALARFTGLQELHISPSDAAAVDEQENFRLDRLLPSVAGLRHLRSLTFEQLSDPGCLQYVPGQVQELSVGFKEPPGPGQVQLGHVTCLTRLNLSNSSHNYWWDRKSVLDAADVLPRSLQTVRLKDCESVQPLLQLQHLTALELGNCTTRATQLQQLSCLSSLQQIAVTCFGDASLESSAPAWCDLRNLSLFLYLGGRELQSVVMQQLGRAHGLTSLSLSNFLVGAPELAAVLQELTCLTKLSLEHGCWLMGAAAAPAIMGSIPGAVAMHCDYVDSDKGCEAGPVVCAISALPQLQALRCVWVPFGHAAVKHLHSLASHLCGGFVLHYCD